MNEQHNAGAAATAQPISLMKLYSLNGKYCIAPKNSQSELRDDANCWDAQATAIVSHLAMELSDEKSGAAANPREVSDMLFAALTLLEMAANVRKAIFAIQQLEKLNGGVQ